MFAKNVHNESHFGRDRCFNLIRDRYYGVSKVEVDNIVKVCIQCQASKLMATKAQIKPIISKRPRDRYLADLVCLQAYKDLNNGYSFLLVVVDSFSKFGIVRQLRTKSAEEVSQAFNSIFFQFGPPILLYTDNGTEFKNQKLNIVCEFLEIKQIFGRARCPWIQGQVERLNQSIKRWISKTSRGNGEFGTYSNCLERVLYNYNSSCHETTKKIPFELFMAATKPTNASLDHLNSLEAFDPEITNNNEIENQRLEALQNTQKSAEKMIKKRKWKNDEIVLSIGDEVFLKKDTDFNPSTRKFPLNDHISDKIYEIIDKDGEFYKIKNEDEILEKIHISRIKRLNK